MGQRNPHYLVHLIYLWSQGDIILLSWIIPLVTKVKELGTRSLRNRLDKPVSHLGLREAILST